jgi:hypothetical protein
MELDSDSLDLRILFYPSCFEPLTPPRPPPSMGEVIIGEIGLII